MADASYSEVIQIFSQAIAQNDTGKLFVALGLGSLCMGCYAIYKAINTPPPNVSRLQKILITACCSVGIIAIGIGSTISFVIATKRDNERRFVKEVLTPAEAFKRLEANKRVSWLIRIITHNETDDSLEVNRLNRIGRDEQKFTFVADYDELRGRTAAEAARMLGMQMSGSDKVSAIIFPVAGRQIYPVNARGLLQVIASVDATLPEKDRFNVSTRLSANDLVSLSLNKKQDSTLSYAWTNYKDNYPQYCQVVQIFRCSPVERVAASIGDITDDWHPLGFARRQPLTSVDPCKQTSQYCSIVSWENATKQLLPTFGARVFLTQNVEIKSLKSRILIEFGQPESEKIPYLYLPDIQEDQKDFASAE